MKKIQLKWVAIGAALGLIAAGFLLHEEAKADVLGFGGGMYNQGLQGFCAPAAEMYLETDNYWRFGILAHEKDLSCRYKDYDIAVEQNIGFYAGKFYPLGWFRFGIGAAIWEHQTFAVGSTPCRGHPVVCERGGLQITVLLSAEVDIIPLSRWLPGDWYLGMRHGSGAGAPERNKGHDFAPMIGFRAKR